MHTRDKDQANNASFYEPIEAAKGVFILGGKTERITASYANTATEDALRELLNRNGIIAGVSAGSGVQANYFSSQEKQQGFEFLQGVIIMNHFLAKNKLFDHSLQILDHAEYLSLGIDNNIGGIRFQNIAANDAAVNSKVNAMLDQGWEIVQIASGVEAVGGKDDNNGLYLTRFYFKKAK